jgi:hypothetical protein
MISDNKANKPKLTDADRHKRFVDMAHKLEIPEDADLPTEYFKKLTTISRHRTDQKGKPR